MLTGADLGCLMNIAGKRARRAKRSTFAISLRSSPGMSMSRDYVNRDRNGSEGSKNNAAINPNTRKVVMMLSSLATDIVAILRLGCVSSTY